MNFSKEKISAFLFNPPIWPIFFGIFLGLLFNHKWSEPDAYAFYNRTCLNGADFHTPFLSKFFFLHLPCEQWVWFACQALLWTISLYAIAWSLKKFLNIETRAVFLGAFSPFLLQLMTSFEDDFLVFPLIIILSYWHMKRRDWISFFTLLIVGVFLSLTIWEGAIIPLSIIALSVMNPFLGIGEILTLFFMAIIGHPNPDPANESRIGYGFSEYGLFWFIVAIGANKQWKQTIAENWNCIKVAIPFLLLTILDPKFGLYSLIPLIPTAYNIFSKKDYFRQFVRAGFIILVFYTLFFLMVAPPNADHWKVFNQAVSLQKKGNVVLNYWSLGDYLAFLGGVPSQRGGSGPFQDANGVYWIGYARQDCNTLAQAQVIFLQKC